MAHYCDVGLDLQRARIGMSDLPASMVAAQTMHAPTGSSTSTPVPTTVSRSDTCLRESGSKDTENTDIPHQLVAMTEPLEDVLVASIGVLPSRPPPLVLGIGHKTKKLCLTSPGLMKPDDLKKGLCQQHGGKLPTILT